VGQASDIARTVASTANEPMLVPWQIAESLAYLLPTYRIAVEVASAA
jgi:hypothetical protein